MSEFAKARGPITLGLMIAMFMGTLDQTVVNVSLPHMQGSLSASQDQITWVVTSYMVATAVTMPISSWLAGRFGIRPMVLACIGLFTLTSLLCGLAVNMPEMVLVRFAQGMTYAPLQPLAQAVLLRVYPPERFGRAMAIFAMASIAGPVIGPGLGGYITDHLSWRWCFYINLPTGLISFLLLWLFMPKEEPEPRRFDFLGFTSLALGIAALQLVLDRGPTQDWFNSAEIWAEAIAAATGIWIFITHTLTAKDPLFHRALVGDRNFVAGMTLQFLFTMLFYCSVALLPLILQNTMGYSAAQAGLLNFPRSVVVVIILQAMGRLDTLVDRRLLVAFGMSVFALSCWLMSGYDLSMSSDTIISATLVQGVGQGFVNVPVSTLAFLTLGAMLRTDASTVSSLLRNIAGSLGISISQWLMVFNGQRMHASLAAHVAMDNPVVRAGLPAYLSPDTVQGAIALNAEITRQSTMVAFVDNYRLMFFAAVLCIPLLLLMRNRGFAARAVPPEV